MRLRPEPLVPALLAPRPLMGIHRPRGGGGAEEARSAPPTFVERRDHLVAALLDEFAVLVRGVAELLPILADVGEPRLEGVVLDFEPERGCRLAHAGPRHLVVRVLRRNRIPTRPRRERAVLPA